MPRLLTSLLIRGDVVRDTGIGIAPHELSNRAVDAVATDEDITLFSSTVVQFDNNAILVVDDVYHALARYDVGLVRQLLMDNAEKVSPLHSNRLKAVSMHMRIWQIVVFLRDFLPFAHHVEKRLCVERLPGRIAHMEHFQRQCLSFQSLEASNLMKDSRPITPE